MHHSDNSVDMRPLIVGITGPAGSGKSTAAGALVADGYQRLPLALPIKHMLRAGLGLTEEETDGQLKQVVLSRLGLTVTPRTLMQTLGTEWGRDIDEHFWLKAWQARADKMIPHTGQGRAMIVVDDVRFMNEALFLRSLGARIICIKGRPTVLRGSEQAHWSEIEWARIGAQDWVRTVEGRGTVRDFQDRVRRAAY